MKAREGPHNAGDADARFISRGFYHSCERRLGLTHNKPMAKTAEMPTLRPVGIFNDDMQNKGIKNIETSETTLINAADIITAARLKQRPGISGSHILRCGTQIKRVVKKYIV